MCWIDRCYIEPDNHAVKLSCRVINRKGQCGENCVICSLHNDASLYWRTWFQMVWIMTCRPLAVKTSSNSSKFYRRVRNKSAIIVSANSNALVKRSCKASFPLLLAFSRMVKTTWIFGSSMNIMRYEWDTWDDIEWNNPKVWKCRLAG